MVAAADAPHGGGGAHGRHHFAFEIVLDEVSDPNPNPNPNPTPKPTPTRTLGLAQALTVTR